MKRSILAFVIFASAISSCKKDDFTSSIKLDSTELTLKVGERHQFQVTRADQVYTVEEFSWASSDGSVGDVNGSGQFHAGKEGIATVTATHSKQSSIVLKCKVTVVK